MNIFDGRATPVCPGRREQCLEILAYRLQPQFADETRALLIRSKEGYFHCQLAQGVEPGFDFVAFNHNRCCGQPHRNS